MNKKLVLMQGNEACVEGALAAGMRFFAGYPITPSTEIAEVASKRLPMLGGHFMQMEDEISSMAAVIGASAAGVRAMTATSGPGFSLKQENIGYASYAELPCVIVDVQRAGPSTGLPTSPAQGDVMQAKWGTHGDHPIIALSPSSVLECYTLTARAFMLADKYMVPVIMLMDEIVGHMREGIAIPDKDELDIGFRKIPDKNDKTWKPYKGDENGAAVLPPFGAGWRYHITGLTHDERGYPTSKPEVSGAFNKRILDKIENNRDDIVTYDEYETEDADVIAVCYGGTARCVKEAVVRARNEGLKAGMFRAVTIWPFPAEQILKIADKAKKIIVVEHNYGQFFGEVERAVHGKCGVKHLGRVDGTVLMPDEILSEIEEAAK